MNVTNADRVGRTRTITALTPLRPGGVLWLRVFFAIARRFPAILRIEPMKAVHFTYWSVLTAIPYNGPPQLPERPRRPYLLWQTVFNAAIDPYVEAFVVAVRVQINITWWFAKSYPGTKSVARLSDYITQNTRPGSYTYSAYPEATVRTVLSALDVRGSHQALHDAAKTTTPAEFAALYRQFLIRHQRDL
jgi:hypothetical protein